MPSSDFRPFTVRLGPHKVKVTYEPGTPKRSGYYGLCRTSPKTGIRIQIWDKGRRSRWSTLWHELLHAMSEATNAKLTERQVRRLEVCMQRLCRDNPALMKKIVRGI